MYERVTLIPSQALFTVSLMLPTYCVTGMSPFLRALPMTEVYAISTDVDVSARLQGEGGERNQPRHQEECKVQRVSDRSDLRLTLRPLAEQLIGKQLGHRGEHHQAHSDRHQVLPAEVHHLVHPDAREGPPNPHDDVHQHQPFEREHRRGREVVPERDMACSLP